MVRQRHRRVADPRREHLHEHRRDRPVHHRHIDHEQRQDRHRHRPVQLRRIGLGGVPGALERPGQRLIERLGLILRVGSLAVVRVDHRIAHLDLRLRSRRRRHVRVVQARFGQRALGDVARTREFRRTHRVELERALVRIRHDDDRRLLLRRFERRIRIVRERLEQREVGQRRDQAARHDHRLTADPVRQRAEEHEEGRADQQPQRDQNVGGRAVHLERLRQEEQRVELTRVPDDGLTGRQADQRDDHDLQVAPLTERFGQRRFRRLAFGFDTLECGRFGQLQTNPHGNAQQNQRRDERKAPAPSAECVFSHRGAHAEDHEQRQEQPQRRRRLDPRGVITAAVSGRVLGDIGRSPAVLAAEREALQQAHGDEDHRRSEAYRRIPGQEADDERRQPHDHDRDQERVLAPDHIAEPPEYERAERTHRKAGREAEQREDKGGRRIDAGEKALTDVSRERTR